MSNTPENTIGYGAVIVADLDEYQGFYIVEDEDIRANSLGVMLSAMASGVSPVGAIQAALVEGVLTKDWSLVGGTALSLYGLTQEKFFIIKASKEPEGTRTEMIPLAATTVDAARAEIEARPDVIALKGRLVEAMVNARRN